MTKAKILVVEDEALIAQKIENKLLHLGYNVPAAVSSGAEAIQKVEALEPDLVLMDIGLNGEMDGIAAAAEIQNRRDLPIVYLTAYADADTLQRAKITQPFGYITKPFDERELHTTIETALYQHRLERRLRESEERYRIVAETATDAIITIDETSQIIFVNSAAETTFGYTRDELLGQPLQMLIPKPVHHAHHIALNQYINTGQKHGHWQAMETRGIHKNGREILLEISLGESVKNNKHFFTGVMRDITERKQTATTLQDNIHELKIAYRQAIIYAQELTREITERRQAEQQIQQLNAELEQRVADRTRDLSLLYEVTLVASESLAMETMLERSLERVLAATGHSIGAIHLLDEEGAQLRLAAQQGVPKNLIAEIDTIPLENSLATWIMTHGEPVLAPDLAADRRTPLAIRRFKEFIAYLGLPMRTRGQTLGVLSITAVGREQEFNAEEVALLASVADQVGVAVENARLRQQAERAAVIEERERLARELHDSVTQSLYSLSLFAEAGENLIEAGDLAAAKHNLSRMGETAQQALKEMRLLVYELRPLDLEREGLIGALHQRLSAVEGRVNIRARLVAEELVELPASVEEELYRISQEALNNALKHAGATTVTVHLRIEEEQVVLEVVDDGTGFDPRAIIDAGGLGLVSMQERAEKLGGTLTIHSSPEEGTRVKVSVPTQDL
ncbi:MAG: PAS domain S-box protein [Anaerolineae bacterium]|nr:PAS domain S-box protein [Anaerolineae bacterium]